MLILLFVIYLTILFGLSFVFVQRFRKGALARSRMLIATVLFAGSALLLTKIYMWLILSLSDKRPELPEFCSDNTIKSGSFECIAPNIIAPLSFESVLPFVLYPVVMGASLAVFLSVKAAPLERKADILRRHFVYFMAGLFICYGFMSFIFWGA